MKKLIFTLAYLGLITSIIAQHQFEDITLQVGISGQNGLGHAVGWGDINNDGYEDVAFSNQEGSGFWLYKNDEGAFQNITSSAGLSGNSGEKILFVEINGDEWIDLVLRPRSGTQKIYLNNGDETFSLMSGSGVSEGIRLAADFNNDGWLDLVGTSNGSCTIFYNEEGNSFQAENIGTCSDIFAAIAFDYNQDGWQDIYLSTYGDSQNYLFKNMGDGSFENTTTEAGLSYPYSGHGLASADFNNDGLIDVYVGSYSNSSNCKLFQNNGDGTFSDITSSVGASGHQDTRNTSFVDYNNDGWMDIFSSHHDFYSYSNTLQRNDEAENFVDVGPVMNISGEWLGDYFGIGWADFDNDGDMDLFGAGHIDKYVLWENQNCPGHFLEIVLEGVESNFSAVGASVTVWKEGQILKRWIQAGQGRLDAHSSRLHFGLAESTSIDSLLVEWPSGNTHFFESTQIPIDVIWTITEDINLPTNQLYKMVDISLFPNPATRSFSISSSKIKAPFQLMILNSQSQIVLQKSQVYSNQLVQLPSSIKAGVYFVKLFNEEGEMVLKLLVE